MGDTRTASAEQRKASMIAMQKAFGMVARSTCKGAATCHLSLTKMSPVGCSSSVVDCVKDKSKKEVSSELKKKICKGGAAIVDDLKNGDFNEAWTGKKDLPKGVSKKGTDTKKGGKQLGDYLYKMYECKTNSGSSANDSNGKYGRRRVAQTYVLN